MQEETHRHDWQDRGLEIIMESVWEVRFCPCGLEQYRRHARWTGQREGQWLAREGVQAQRLLELDLV